MKCVASQALLRSLDFILKGWKAREVSRWLGGWHGLLYISESPLTCRVEAGAGQGRANLEERTCGEALEEPRDKKRVTKTGRVNVGRGRRKKKKSTTLFD